MLDPNTSSNANSMSRSLSQSSSSSSSMSSELVDQGRANPDPMLAPYSGITHEEFRQPWQHLHRDSMSVPSAASSHSASMREPQMSNSDLDLIDLASTASSAETQGYYSQDQLARWVDSSPADEWSDRDAAAQAIRNAHDGRVVLSRLMMTSLPTGLRLVSLELDQCPWIRSLPHELPTTHDLVIIGCARFTELPSVQLQGQLMLSGLPLFHEWHGQYTVTGDVTVMDCPSLMTMPFWGRVNGSLTVSHCAGVRGLSDRLSVGTDLRVMDCAQLSDLPFQTINLGRHLYLEDLPLLQGLPGWLDQLNQGCDGREIVFHNIGVPMAEQRQIQQRLTDVNVVLDDAGANGNIASTLETEIQRWLELSEAGHDGEAQELVRELPQSLDLREFLQRLAHTREYELQPVGLATRVCLFLHQLADDLIPREEALEAIHQMLTSCNDGLMICLRDLEVLAMVESAQRSPMPDTRLRHIGEDLLKLEVIRTCAFDIAQMQRQQGSDPDEVEILLYLETHLAPRMALPLQNRHMLFSTRAGVTAAQVDETQSKAEAAVADPEQVEAFLSKWRPWQVVQRRQAVESFSRAGRTLHRMPEALKETLCPLTLEPGSKLREPVSLSDQFGVFELDHLLQWWQDNGCHPVTRLPFDLDDIELLRKSI